MVTLDLPGDLAERAAAVAAEMHQRVEDVLLEWLSLGAGKADDVLVALLSDDEVLALRDLQMDVRAQSELSDLLARQREGDLDGPGQRRLDELMGEYRRGMVRKAEALKVAVDRGLQPALGAGKSA